MAHSLIALLVGETGAGKTTVCERVACLARRRGLVVGGIITRPLKDAGGRKVGLEAVDLGSGSGRLLASLERPLGDLRQGPYFFDPAAFAWAAQAMGAALAAGPDLVILDEIGPLELRDGRGFAPLLGPLLAAGYPALLVVRRSWRRALEGRLGVPALAFEVDAGTRDAAPGEVLGALCAASSRPLGFCHFWPGGVT